MEINKAIEILSEVIHGDILSSYQDYLYAVKMGIDALNKIKEVRSITGHPDWQPLPGEVLKHEYRADPRD